MKIMKNDENVKTQIEICLCSIFRREKKESKVTKTAFDANKCANGYISNRPSPEKPYLWRVLSSSRVFVRL